MIGAAEQYLGYYMGTSDLNVTRSKGDPHGTFPQSFATALASDPQAVKVVSRYGTGTTVADATGKSATGFRSVDVIGIMRPQDTAVDMLQMESGRWFDGSRGTVAVIDQVLAERLKLKVGDSVVLSGAEKPLKVEVVGIVHKPGIMATADQQTVYVPLETLQQFTGRPGQINRIMISLRPGADPEAFKQRWAARMAAADPLMAMKSAGDLRQQMQQNLASIHFLSYLGSTVSLIAATFIIFSTLSMGVIERSRTLAMLRAVGALRGQLAWLVVLEGAFLAAAGVVIGAPLGVGWVKLLAVMKPDHFPVGVIVGWAGLLFGVIASIASALAASLLPAFNATRVDPIAALTAVGAPPASRFPLAAALGGLLAVSIDPLLVFLPTSREIKWYGHFALGLPGLLVGFFLLSPMFVWVFEALCSATIARLMGLRPALLRQQLSSGIWRAAGTCSALMVGLAVLIVMQVQGNSILNSWKLPDKFPDIFIWARGGISRDQAKRLENIPGIRPGELLPVGVTAAIVSGENLDVKGTSMIPQASMFFGIDPDKALRMIELQFRDDLGNTAPPAEQARMNRAATEDLKLGRHIIITDEYFRLLGKKRGDTLILQTPLHGNVQYTIAGVVWSPGIDVMVSMFDMGRQFDQRTATSMFGSLRDIREDFGVNDITFFAANLEYGMDKNKLVTEMEKNSEEKPASQPTPAPKSLLESAAGLFSRATSAPSTQSAGGAFDLFKGVREALGAKGMQAGDVRVIKYKIEEGFSKILMLLSTVAFASMAVAALGVANTIMASIRSRRWQFGILRSIGVTRSQLLRLVLAEAMLLGITGAALGLAAGFLMTLDANGLSKYILGLVVPLNVPWKIVGAGVLIVVATSLVASLWPAGSVARAEPLSLLQAGRASA